MHTGMVEVAEKECKRTGVVKVTERQVACVWAWRLWRNRRSQQSSVKSWNDVDERDGLEDERTTNFNWLWSQVHIFLMIIRAGR